MAFAPNPNALTRDFARPNQSKGEYISSLLEVWSQKNSRETMAPRLVPVWGL